MKIVVSNFSNTMNDVAEIIREQNGFETPSLNEHLYLHMKGFRKIEGLEAYVNLKTLWLQSNVIERIENLEANTVLDLSGNLLSSVKDVEHLQKCTSLTNIDLSANNLDDANIKDLFSPKHLPSLRCLSLRGNPVVNKIKNYRKSMIVVSPSLCKLDSRAILKSDREVAEAWASGKSIKEVRASQKNELKKRHQTQMKRYRKWKERRRKELLSAAMKNKSDGDHESTDTKEEMVFDSETKRMLGSKVLNRNHPGSPVEGTVTGFDSTSKLFRVDYVGTSFSSPEVLHNKSHAIFTADDTWDCFALDFLREMLVISSTEEEEIKTVMSSSVPPNLPDAISSDVPEKVSEDDAPKVPTLSTTIVDELD